MKLVTVVTEESKEEVGVLKEEGSVLLLKNAGFNYKDMNDLIINADAKELDKIRDAEGEVLKEGSYKIISPIPRPLQDVLCIGLNYKAHAAEAFNYSDAFEVKREEPIFFSKRVSYSQGTDSVIPAHADITKKLDFENELGVIIGKNALNVSEEDAEKYVFGYTIINDVSARDLQTNHKQWYFGKSLDGFTPMGPCIVTADEIAYPPALHIHTKLNGETRQDSNTSLLIHGISEIISTLSKGMTLKAGTIIATGTPKGVLMGMGNPEFLKNGDVIDCAIDGIGNLVNVVF